MEEVYKNVFGLLWLKISPIAENGPAGICTALQEKIQSKQPKFSMVSNLPWRISLIFFFFIPTVATTTFSPPLVPSPPWLPQLGALFHIPSLLPPFIIL